MERKACRHNVISAQCSECQSEEIQISAGKRRELTNNLVIITAPGEGQ